ncbi:MAG: hypothetical protein PQJ49_10490 [Sphaerochaetaceae bacterium]|jgi:hypothetical protein|nr:hypothetical protein [Sphaerochaetaceae bacterium]
MDEFNILKNTLAFFNFELTEAGFEQASDKNIKICKFKLQQAIRRVQEEFSWSFLLMPLSIELDTTVNHKMGYQVAYKLPNNILRLSTVFSDDYRRAGNYILSNDSSLEVWGMTSEIPENVPSDFWDLVSTALAIIVLPTIMPSESNLLSLIIQQYQWQSQAMIKADLKNNLKKGNLY